MSASTAPRIDRLTFIPRESSELPNTLLAMWTILMVLLNELGYVVSDSTAFRIDRLIFIPRESDELPNTLPALWTPFVVNHASRAEFVSAVIVPTTSGIDRLIFLPLESDELPNTPSAVLWTVFMLYRAMLRDSSSLDLVTSTFDPRTITHHTVSDLIAFRIDRLIFIPREFNELPNTLSAMWTTFVALWLMSDRTPAMGTVRTVTCSVRLLLVAFPFLSAFSFSVFELLGSTVIERGFVSHRQLGHRSQGGTGVM